MLPATSPTIFEWAQPTFKNNYMYMSGHTDAAPFDRELAERMPLANQVAGIHCPVLVGIGEFDELTPPADAIANFERIRAPKELRVYENEFHPLGGVAAEIFRYGAEWLERVLAGQLSQAGRDVRHYVQRDGTISNGSADPRWWMGRVPPTIAELRKSEV